MSSAGGDRPLRADARRNRDRLVDAARTIFTERGSETSMEEVARRADVGVGTLYRHFPKRIDLVEAVYLEDVDTLVGLVSELCTGDAWAAIEGWLKAFVAYAAAKRTFLTELREAFEKSPNLAVASREKIRAATGQVLTYAQEGGAARLDIDGHELLQLVSGMCMASNATKAENERLLVFILDGIRTHPSAR